MHIRCFASLILLAACRPAERSTSDSAFAEVQRRGQTVMGVDQYTSKHIFEDLVDGGRIVLERDDPGDTNAIQTIRAHMRDIATSFRAGNFAAPGLVHAGEVPGTRTMAERKAEITYSVNDRPRGADVRIVGVDPKAIAAIHEFLAFQRSDHKAAGHETH